MTKGQAVVMNDGWRGKVLHLDGQTVVAIRDGERPNDWLRGYRAFKRALVTITNDKATIRWEERGCTRRRDVIDLGRARAERERARVASSWDSAPL
jgi:hypothetical protein